MNTRNHRRSRRMPATTRLLLALAVATTACFVAWTVAPDVTP